MGQGSLRDSQQDSPLPAASLTADRAAFRRNTNYRYRLTDPPSDVIARGVVVYQSREARYSDVSTRFCCVLQSNSNENEIDLTENIWTARLRSECRLTRSSDWNSDRK